MLTGTDTLFVALDNADDEEKRRRRSVYTGHGRDFSRKSPFLTRPIPRFFWKVEFRDDLYDFFLHLNQCEIARNALTLVLSVWNAAGSHAMGVEEMILWNDASMMASCSEDRQVWVQCLGLGFTVRLQYSTEASGT
jgi:hypothetical protein